MSENTNKIEENKALFFQRLIAFIIDVSIICLIASMISTPFIDIDKSNKLTEESTEIMQKYMNHEISTKDYSIKFMNISYSLARNNGFLSIVTILLEIVYFIVFQIYKNGQTIGKKIMRIRVVADNGDLSMNQLIIRSLIANSILLEIITFAFMVFTSKDIYFYSTGIFGLIQYVIILISIFMVMFRKDGCSIHDKIAHTKVIRI